MDTNEELIRTMHDEPNKAYDYFSNNYYNLTNSEKVNITKELLYAIYDMCDEDTQRKILMTAAENLADSYEVELYPDEIFGDEKAMPNENLTDVRDRMLDFDNKEFLDKTNCIDEKDYGYKLLILRPDVLAEGFRNSDYQYFFATTGFGCKPDGTGKVFGSFLKDGEKSYFYRRDFIGVADTKQLPDWAKLNLDSKLNENAPLFLQSDGKGRK